MLYVSPAPNHIPTSYTVLPCFVSFYMAIPLTPRIFVYSPPPPHCHPHRVELHKVTVAATISGTTWRPAQLTGTAWRPEPPSSGGEQGYLILGAKCQGLLFADKGIIFKLGRGVWQRSAVRWGLYLAQHWCSNRVYPPVPVHTKGLP